MKAADVTADSYWPGLFAKLAEKRNIDDLIISVGTGGGATVAVAAPVGGAASPPEVKKATTTSFLVECVG